MVKTFSRRDLVYGTGALFLAPLAAAPPERSWAASWITAQGAPSFEYGVYHFRLALDLSEKPVSFPVHVSADNRYQLFVNGTRTCWGPARGDLSHWRYETVDLAPFLHAGRNVLAAVVWNFGEYAPEAQVTWRTGFLLQGAAAASERANTGPEWKAWRDPAYRPLPRTTAEMRGYFVAGPGDSVDAALYPWGWETESFDDGDWKAAARISPGTPRDASDSPNRWMLVPRSIPPMEEKPESPLRIRLAEGIEAPSSFPMQIPAGRKVRLILDQGYLTTAYPEITVTGGRGAVVRIGYAESLYSPGAKRGDKGDRNAVEGKEFIGYYDSLAADGEKQRVFRPLWWRTYRYIELVVTTQADPITLERLSGTYTGYPFERKARFKSSETSLERILDVGWRTARLCAHETYVDCPYYEQLQYVGDTRIQALISLYTSGDDRLMRNAIEQIDSSRTPEGATMSRAPTRLQQYIPSFSLWWIGMVHDHWIYRGDREFIRRMLPGVRALLTFFGRYRKSNGSLGYLPWWRYCDWANEWARGEPPSEPDGSSAPFDLQYLLALAWAAALEQAVGSAALAGECNALAGRLSKTVRELYWDPARMLFADTPRWSDFSQQTNALAVLAGIVAGREATSLVERTLAEPDLTKCSYYFRHYLHCAVNQAGLGDRYLDLLADWHAMLERGLTTFEERQPGAANESRSDCHAWTASPNFEIFRTVLGIDSAAPGFRRVVVRPFLGRLSHASGAIPHPQGEVSVAFERTPSGLRAEVSLPVQVTGEFVWRGRRRQLASGTSRFTVG
jgi:hypothetical protein